MRLTAKDRVQSLFDRMTFSLKGKEKIKTALEVRRMLENAGAGWIGGCPLGASYIDSRASGDLIDRLFVAYDHILALEFPSLSGKSVAELYCKLGFVGKKREAKNKKIFFDGGYTDEG